MTIVSLSKPHSHHGPSVSLTKWRNRMLKDKKKLTTKVESLTRKVQSLENKLTAAKGQAPGPSVQNAISPPARTTASGSTALSNPIPPAPIYDPTTPVSRPTSNRVVSGPASLPRPKTPEHRLAQPAVFTARTPEKRTMSTATPPLTVTSNMQVSTSISSVGKKRARPDEFDDISVPVEALYAENERENATPRLRRALHGVQSHSGFTPVRQTKARASHGAPSPGRRATMGMRGITDVTNSPRSVASQTAKAGKRSWLGKIRGVSSNPQTTNSHRTPSSRSVFERVPG
jgi:hypothetical protein